MKRALFCVLAICLFPALSYAAPETVVSGVTLYNPAAANNGFTVLAGGGSIKLVDMNGNLVHEWLGGGSPNKIYPGGFAASAWEKGLGIRDFDDNPIRAWNQYMKDADGAWYTNMHHDFQVEGNSVGYYSPSAEFHPDGKLLILTQNTLDYPEITPGKPLLDDGMLIVDADGNIIFEWWARDHIDQFYNMASSPEVMSRLRDSFNYAIPQPTRNDWFHINCASWLGPNKWYDQDPVKYSMFHPENIISDSRNTSHMFIIDHLTGDVVWQVAPPFVNEDAKLGAFHGVHATHMIPQGLPGEGNILVYDNGGWGAFHPEAGVRVHSRVVEYDPVTKEVVWEYNPAPSYTQGYDRFFSIHISNAQRLPNGNTLICEGSQSRIFEVNPAGEIVWEFINPYTSNNNGTTYRAYRVPYDWVPQLPQGKEVAVTRPDSGIILLPNDNGELPNVFPVKDTNLAPRFTAITPVLLPSLRDQAGSINVFQGGDAGFDQDEDLEQDLTMKAY